MLINTMQISYGNKHKLNRGGARNFGMRGPSCDANILVKTNLYTYTCI